MRRLVRVLGQAGVMLVVLALALANARAGEGQEPPAPTPKDIEKLTKALEEAKAPFAARQAALWILTKNATYRGLGAFYGRRAGGMGFDRIIFEDDAVWAMKLCDDCDFDITERAIWGDRAALRRGLRSEPLRRWLDERENRKKAVPVAPI